MRVAASPCMKTFFTRPRSMNWYDVGRAPQPGCQRVADGGDRQAQRACLLPIDIELVLRLIIQAVRPDHADVGILRRQLHQLAACLHQRFVADIGAVEQLEVEPVALPSSSTAGGAKAATWACRMEAKNLLARAAIAWTGVVALAALAAPAFQADECEARALAMTARS